MVIVTTARTSDRATITNVFDKKDTKDRKIVRLKIIKIINKFYVTVHLVVSKIVYVKLSEPISGMWSPMGGSKLLK